MNSNRKHEIQNDLLKIAKVMLICYLLSTT